MDVLTLAQTQIKEQQIQHVKALQAVQYQAQQTVGDMKRQKLAQVCVCGFWGTMRLPVCKVLSSDESVCETD